MNAVIYYAQRVNEQWKNSHGSRVYYKYVCTSLLARERRGANFQQRPEVLESDFKNGASMFVNMSIRPVRPARPQPYIPGLFHTVARAHPVWGQICRRQRPTETCCPTTMALSAAWVRTSD